MRIPDIKRIRVEDFKSEDQDLVGKLAYSFNSFADQVINIFNKGVDFENLTRQIVTVMVTVDGFGALVNPPKIKFDMRSGKVQGLSVISATNINNPGVYPTTAPFVSFTFSANIITILNVTGLQNNSQYSLVLELIG